MAYSAEIIWKRERCPDGRGRLIIQVTELEAELASAWSTKHTAVTNVVREMRGGSLQDAKDLSVPPTFRVASAQADSAESTINPMLGTPSTPGTFETETMDLKWESVVNTSRASNSFVFEANCNAIVAFPPSRTGDMILSGRSRSSGSSTVVSLFVLDEMR